MSKFKTILSGSAKENMSAVMAAKLEFTRRLLFTSFVLVLACVAGFSYTSRAWFASNKDVSGENASVTSESGTPNLFIRMQGDSEAKYYSIINQTWSVGPGLYPISTADCENWYYISNWAMEYSAKDPVTGITTGEYYASEYTRVDPTADTYTVAGQTRRAYYCGKYNLYSDKEALDVYLNPDSPIVVDIGGNDTNQGLKQAIRVGVVGPDGLVFVYAPVKESGAGKNYIVYEPISGTGTPAAAGKFYAVTGQYIATEQTGILVGDTGLANYIGKKVPGDDHSFTKGDNKICTATTAGADVSVYIWLEGMDAQSIINVADNRTIGVSLNFVGVEPDAAAPENNA